MPLNHWDILVLDAVSLFLSPKNTMLAYPSIWYYKLCWILKLFTFFFTKETPNMFLRKILKSSFSSLILGWNMLVRKLKCKSKWAVFNVVIISSTFHGFILTCVEYTEAVSIYFCRKVLQGIQTASYKRYCINTIQSRTAVKFASFAL